jgi:hypothetical protein
MVSTDNGDWDKKTLFCNVILACCMLGCMSWYYASSLNS